MAASSQGEQTQGLQDLNAAAVYTAVGDQTPASLAHQPNGAVPSGSPRAATPATGGPGTPMAATASPKPAAPTMV